MDYKKNISLLSLLAIGVATPMTINNNDKQQLDAPVSTIRPTVNATDWTNFESGTLPTFGFTESTVKDSNVDKNTIAIIYNVDSSGLPNSGIQGSDLTSNQWEDLYYYDYLVKDGSFQTSIAQDKSKTPENTNDDWVEYPYAKKSIVFDNKTTQNIGLGIISWNNVVGDRSDRYRFYRGAILNSEVGTYEFKHVLNPFVPSVGSIDSITPSTFGFDITYNVDKNSDDGNVEIYVSTDDAYIGNLVYSAVGQDGPYTQTIDGLLSNKTYYVTLVVDGIKYTKSITTNSQDVTIGTFNLNKKGSYVEYTSGAQSFGSIDGSITISNPDNVTIDSVQFNIKKNGVDYTTPSVNGILTNNNTYSFSLDGLDAGNYEVTPLVNYTDSKSVSKSASIESKNINIETQTIETPLLNSINISSYSPPTKAGNWNDGSIDINFNVSFDSIKFDSLVIKIYSTNDTSTPIKTFNLDTLAVADGVNDLETISGFAIGTYYATMDGTYTYTDTTSQTLPTLTTNNFTVEGKALAPTSIVGETLIPTELSNDQLIKGSIDGTISISDIDGAIVPLTKPIVNLYDENNNLVKTIDTVDYVANGNNQNITVAFGDLEQGKYHYSVDIQVYDNSPEIKTITLSSTQEYVVGVKAFNIPRMGFAAAMDYDTATQLSNGLTLTVHSQSFDENNYWGDIKDWRSIATITYQDGTKVLKHISSDNQSGYDDKSIITFSKTEPVGTINLPDVESTIENQIVSIELSTEVIGDNTPWTSVNLSSVTGSLIPIVTPVTPDNNDNNCWWLWIVITGVVTTTGLLTWWMADTRVKNEKEYWTKLENEDEE